MKAKKQYMIKRTVVETFIVYGIDRSDAIKAFLNNEHGCPQEIKVVKETINKTK